MFTHSGTREIRTERLLLRKFRPDDAPAMFANWTSDPEVARYTTWGAHESIQTTEAFLGYLLGKQENANTYAWGIEFGGELVGSIDVVSAEEARRACDIGYCLSRRRWGQGVMTEALRAVIDYLFSHTDFERAEAEHHALNPASGRVMQKAGMHFVEEKPAYLPKEGAEQLVLNYALERAEWRGRA